MFSTSVETRLRIVSYFSTSVLNASSQCQFSMSVLNVNWAQGPFALLYLIFIFIELEVKKFWPFWGISGGQISKFSSTMVKMIIKSISILTFLLVSFGSLAGQGPQPFVQWCHVGVPGSTQLFLVSSSRTVFLAPLCGCVWMLWCL